MSSDRVSIAMGIALSAGLALSPTDKARAETGLAANPETCVSLYRDQPCSQSISFSWSPLPEGQYCLTADDVAEPLVCWQAAALTAHRHAFRSVQERRYSLVRGENGTVLATVVVKRAWVYRGKANSRSGWRVF